MKNKKKYYFDSLMLVLHASKEVLNKMLKYIFSPTNIIHAYLSKKNQNQQNRVNKKIN